MLYRCVKDDYPVFDGFCVSSYSNFLVKSPLLSCFLNRLIDNQHILDLSMCSVADTGLVKAKDLMGCYKNKFYKSRARTFLLPTAWELLSVHRGIFKNTGLPFSWPQHGTVWSLQLISERLICTTVLHRQLEWCWNTGKLSFCLTIIPLGFLCSAPITWHVFYHCLGEILERCKKYNSRSFFFFFPVMSLYLLFFAEAKMSNINSITGHSTVSELLS